MRVFELDQSDIEDGRQEYMEDLERVREMEEFGIGMHVEVLKLPRRARS